MLPLRAYQGLGSLSGPYEICHKHKVRFEREDNHLEEDMDKNQSLKVVVVTGKG